MGKIVEMKPQDIFVLLKIASLNGKSWRMADLANELFMSQSEISKSLNRSRFAGLVDDSKRNLHTSSLVEFLSFGIKYVFPERPGEMVRGTPTAHSALPLSNRIQSVSDVYVWQDEEGLMRGQRIIPLYPSVAKAVKVDLDLYELLALVDAIRVGKVREHQVAIDLLKKRLLKK